MTIDAIIESFHALWGNFPERARLIRKDRTVLAVNKAAEAEGLLAGVRCIDAPPRASHAGCLGNQSLKDGCGQCNLSVNGKRMRYWVPVEGCEDVFVHFSIPIERMQPTH